MANSKFSGAGFASGQNPTNNSVFAGYEIIGPGQGENRRWTAKELFSTQVTDAAGIKFIFTSNQQCLINHNGLSITGTAFNQCNQSYIISSGTSGSGDLSLRVANSEKLAISTADTTHTNAVKFDGGIKDGGNSLGSSGQVLSSTGSGLQWINAGGSTPTLSAVMGQGASYSGSNSVLIQPSSQIILNAGGTNQQLTLGSSGSKRLIGNGLIDVGGLSSNEFLILGTKDFHFNNYEGSIAPNGRRMRITAGGNIEINTGNPTTSTPGGSIIVQSKGASLTLRTLDGSAQGTSYPGGDVTIGSSSGQVNITSDIELQAVVTATNLPTSDPGVEGQLWNDEGTVKISVP